jgi:hypothetical protein
VAHRSRVGVVLVDVAPPEHDATLAFWAAATGREPSTSGDRGEFAALGLHGDVELAVQRTADGTPARVHLDVETDDVDAEVARLVGLGAVVEQRHDEYAVLRDPAGLVFCVVPVQQAEAFDRAATTWP